MRQSLNPVNPDSDKDSNPEKPLNPVHHAQITVNLVMQFSATTMADLFNNKPVFTLLQVTTSIQKTLAERYTSTFWVKAEMNKLNHYSHSGHSYPELLEKKEGKVLAQMKANLWATDYHRVNKKFLDVLKEPLKDGIKILFEASISFDPVYGLALRIHDIDPSYTLGDLEKEKALTLQRLVSEQLINRNKLLQLPLLPKRIAIISVDTSKGYADFIKVLQEIVGVIISIICSSLLYCRERRLLNPSHGN